MYSFFIKESDWKLWTNRAETILFDSTCTITGSNTFFRFVAKTIKTRIFRFGKKLFLFKFKEKLNLQLNVIKFDQITGAFDYLSVTTHPYISQLGESMSCNDTKRKDCWLISEKNSDLTEDTRTIRTIGLRETKNNKLLFTFRFNQQLDRFVRELFTVPLKIQQSYTHGVNIPLLASQSIS